MIRLLLPVLLAAAAACGPKPEPAGSSLPSIPFEAEGELSFVRDGVPIVQVSVEIADDDSTRMRGLMQRTSLPDQSGMLFVFPADDYQSFWMANTQMSLDLIFANDAGAVVTVARYAQPLSTEPVASTAPARYVIEFEAGFADTWGIVEGDSVEWTRY